jgi:hypothetical protein
VNTGRDTARVQRVGFWTQAVGEVRLRELDADMIGDTLDQLAAPGRSSTCSSSWPSRPAPGAGNCSVCVGATSTSRTGRRTARRSGFTTEPCMTIDRTECGTAQISGRNPTILA